MALDRQRSNSAILGDISLIVTTPPPRLLDRSAIERRRRREIRLRELRHLLKQNAGQIEYPRTSQRTEIYRPFENRAFQSCMAVKASLMKGNVSIRSHVS